MGKMNERVSTHSTVAVPSLNPPLVAPVLVSRVWMVLVDDMALDLAKIALDGLIIPALGSEAHPLVVVGRAAFREHHGIHGTAACESGRRK